MNTNTEREELAAIIHDAEYGVTREPREAWPPRIHQAADAILVAGYHKPKILGYAVVDERNTPLMVNFGARTEAEEYALDNTRRMNRQFRVAEIVEATR